MRDAIEVRELAADELPAAWELGRLAFGGLPDPPPHALKPTPGVTRYGAFDATGRLVGKASDLHHEQWWNGRRVPAADVGGVAVLPEARGRGVARAVLTGLLRGARDRGAAVSALYPTVVAPYRSVGWEACGALRTIDLPTVALPRRRPDPALSVRPGGPADMAAVDALYEQVARTRCGLLTRRGGWFPERSADALPEGIDGLTLVEGDGRLLGVAAWQRGRGYDASAVLTVGDLFAVTAAAARELIGVLASWHSVAPTVRLTPPAFDAVTAQLPLEAAREQERRVWMHRPVDVVRAVGARGWPVWARGSVEFVLDDPVAEWNAGAWRLEVADGAAELRPATGEPDLRLSVRGFAALYAGAVGATALAETGLVAAAGGADPAALDLLGPGQPAQLLDYF